MKKIIIGTRGSELALVQTKLVAEALLRAFPGLVTETKIITTKGDVNQSPIPLDTVGKAWFTQEIEEALLKDEIDLAVHSLKDLPPDLPEGLVVVAVLPRADAADVLVSRSGFNLAGLKEGAVIGTDSLRRKALILAMRPDLVVQSIRGNVDTRLKKLEGGDYDAIVIAAAGLARLGLAHRVTERFDPTTFIPAPGQGILAVEMKKERTDLPGAIGAITHAPTSAAAEIELAFSQAIGGGCKLPIGCYAEVEKLPENWVGGIRKGFSGENVNIHAVLGTMDGSRIVRKSKIGPLADGEKMAEELAAEFLREQRKPGDIR